MSTALIGASALTLGGTAAQKDAWLAKIAEGKTVLALAVDEHAHHAPARISMTAKKDGEGYILDGKKLFVVDGGAAEALIVAARTSGKVGEEAGITLFLVPSGAAGITRTLLKTVDSRGAADIAFAGVKVGADAVLGQADHGFDLLDQILDRARAGMAAEMVGQASEAFDITLEYLKTRVQFGQVIGTFQSLQHRAAKMFTALEMTRSCVEAALEALDGNANDARALCSLAKSKASHLVHLVSMRNGADARRDRHDRRARCGALHEARAGDRGALRGRELPPGSVRHTDGILAARHLPELCFTRAGHLLLIAPPARRR